jgi:ATP-binding cassette subfamily B protein
MSMPRISSGHRKRWIILLVANGVAQAVCGFFVAYFLRDALEASRAGSPPWALAIAISVLGGIMLALRVKEASDAERLGQDYVMRVRLRIFDRVAKRPARAEGRRRWGVTMTRLISDLNSLRNWVSLGIARSIVAAVTIVGLLASLYYFSPLSAGAAVVVLSCCGLVVWVLTPRLRGYVREARRRRGRLANNLGEKVFAAHTVRQSGQYQSERRRIRKQSMRLRDALVRRVRTSAILRALPDVARPAAISGITIAAAFSTQSASELVVSVMLVGMIAAAIGDLARAWDYRLAFDQGRARIADVLTGPRIVESRTAVELPGEGPLAVTLDGVCVADALGQIDLEIRPGERVAVIGPAGSGKSTLVSLVARLLEPDAGEVRLAGSPLASIKLDSLHEAVQLVSPLLPLLRGTVDENIGYAAAAGEEDADWIESVIEACGLASDPLLLPDGLDTRVEEQAANLPHGLRARIALARAAAVRPRVLLVDEPAILDDPCALEALDNVLALTGATSLVVCSELGPKPIADRIVELVRPGLEAALPTGRESTLTSPSPGSLSLAEEGWHA